MPSTASFEISFGAGRPGTSAVVTITSDLPIWTVSAWFWIWPTNNFVGSTRFQFAMAFDRMLPSKLTTVVGRPWAASHSAMSVLKGAEPISSGQ